MRGTQHAAYWTRNTENADGNILTETYGNGLIGTRGYDPVMRRLTSLQAGPSGSPNSVQNHGYHYDSLGRLDQRWDNTTGVGTSETFGYDNLNRLTTAILTGPSGTQTSTVSFNAIGNITSKSGVGTYAYNPSGAASVRPHAVSGVTGTVNGVTNPSYGYDNNGNMLTDGARGFTWTSFNMPATLTKTAQAGSPGAGTSTFLYGPEHQRLKQTWVDSSKTLSTYYLSEPHFEKEVNSQTGLTEYKHYISAGSRIVAIQTRRNGGAGTWTQIAVEWEEFSVSGTQTVRYGVNDSWVQKVVTGTGSCTNDYFGSDPALGTYKHCEVLSGGGGASEDIKYLIPDHLGSTSVVTDATGAVLDRQAYDPWGDRRTASGSSAGAADPTHLIQPTSTDRGYTGHEHLDQGNMGLVHMNGRVYDPTLGRFISADPYVQAPYNTQSFSRFSYVSNGPLNAIDPSGFYEESETARRAFGTGGFSGSGGFSPMTTIGGSFEIFDHYRTFDGGTLYSWRYSFSVWVPNGGAGFSGAGPLFGVTLSEFGSPERAAAREASLRQLGAVGQRAAASIKSAAADFANSIARNKLLLAARMLAILATRAPSGSDPTGGAKDAPTTTTGSPTQEWIYGPENDPKINPDGSTKPNTWTTPDKYPDRETAVDKLDPFKPVEGRRPANIPEGTDVQRGRTPGGEGPYNGRGGARETLIPGGLPPGSVGRWEPL